MSCNTSLSAIIKTCDNNIGGIVKFYIAPTEFVTSASVTGTTAGQIDSITMSGSAKFVEFKFNKNTATLDETGTSSLENGSKFYAYKVVIKLPRREVVKRNALALIGAGNRDLKLICTDGNGLNWYVGFANSANLISQTGGFGATKGDGSTYILEFLAEEPAEIYEVTDAALASVI